MASSLEELKSEYEKFRVKYNLPEFKEINEIFGIEEIDRESEILLRVIRNVMDKRIISLLGFLEMFMNPMSVPRMYHGFLKSMTENDKQNIEDLYKEFAELTLLSMESDSNYNESKEADTIKRIFCVWKENSEKLTLLIKRMKEPVKANKRERNYFG